MLSCNKGGLKRERYETKCAEEDISVLRIELQEEEFELRQCGRGTGYGLAITIVVSMYDKSILRDGFMSGIFVGRSISHHLEYHT